MFCRIPASAAGERRPVAPIMARSTSLAQTSVLRNYLMAFEVTSILLLVAVVGAVALARGSSAAGRARPPPTAGSAHI